MGGEPARRGYRRLELHAEGTEGPRTDEYRQLKTGRLLEGGGEITSVITKKGVEDLGLTVGKEVYAVIKSTEIMVGVD